MLKNETMVIKSMRTTFMGQVSDSKGAKELKGKSGGSDSELLINMKEVEKVIDNGKLLALSKYIDKLRRLHLVENEVAVIDDSKDEKEPARKSKRPKHV